MDEELSPDIACEELRSAVQAVSKVTGHIDVENVLDVLFKDFCIGKWQFLKLNSILSRQHRRLIQQKLW